ncbi:MAG: Arginase [Candidatus Heimdallarchaeota archaeon LC_3]|nr:MAG: Arginase [Candidatus Heimdallarchaeota archaeon LC_3]
MAKKKIVVFDAPSNLGLNPPENGVIPGCYKLPWALRDRKLLEMLKAVDGGSLVPPRYNSSWKRGEGDRNAEAIAKFSNDIANRIENLLEDDQKLVILGGDCSILIGSMLALKRQGRYGLVFLDAHSDFRHPNNSQFIGAAAGEDLAIVTGRGDSRLTNLEGKGSYLLEEDIHIVGMRENDEALDEITNLNISVTTSQEINEKNVKENVANIIETVSKNTKGFWIHLDMDVIDSSEMTAVDCPEPNGLSFLLLSKLLKQLFHSPNCFGIEITIYDPDLDPTGIYAEKIIDCLRRSLI